MPVLRVMEPPHCRVRLMKLSHSWSATTERTDVKPFLSAFYLPTSNFYREVRVTAASFFTSPFGWIFVRPRALAS